MANPQQADGAYPRLNAAMVGSGKYNGMIVSLVGKLLSTTSFQCCDGGTVQLSGDHADISDMDSNNNGMVVEIVGQVASPTLVAVCKNTKKSRACAPLGARFGGEYLDLRLRWTIRLM